MLEIEITHIIDTFKLIKTILNQNICIIDNIIEQTQLSRKDNFKGIRHNIYTFLCQIENFLLYFLYHTLTEAEFKEQVKFCLKTVYHYRIRYSDFFSTIENISNY